MATKSLISDACLIGSMESCKENLYIGNKLEIKSELSDKY